MYALLCNDYSEGAYFHAIDLLLFILFRMALTFYVLSFSCSGIQSDLVNPDECVQARFVRINESSGSGIKSPD